MQYKQEYSFEDWLFGTYKESNFRSVQTFKDNLYDKLDQITMRES